MSHPDLLPNHRQVVSAIAALVLGGETGWTPYLKQLGYSLNLIEPRMMDRHSRTFEPDIHLVQEEQNLSLLIECKTGDDYIRDKQLECYFDMDGSSVVSQGRLNLLVPRQHMVNAVFFATPVAVEKLRSALASLGRRAGNGISGHGLVEVGTARIRLSSDSLSDKQLAASLHAGWTVEVWRLPLERIPYTLESPSWLIAEFVLQALAQLFFQGIQAFSLEDICVASNAWWPYFGDRQRGIEGKVRQILSQVRRTALRGWLETSPRGAVATREWQFTKAASGRANVALALQRRCAHYVRILKEGKQPHPEDFTNIEQLTLPELS